MKQISSLFRDRVNPERGNSPAVLPEAKVEAVTPEQRREFTVQYVRSTGDKETRVPFNPSRPYHTGGYGPKVTPEQHAHVRLLGASEKNLNAVELENYLIPDDKRAFLKRKQRQLDKINVTLKRARADGIIGIVRESRQKLNKGRGSLADSQMDKGNAKAAIRALKRQHSNIIDHCKPTLIEIAKRVEEMALLALPKFEAEALKLQINPCSVPMVRTCGTCCWLPSEQAQTSQYTPKTTLRMFAVKL